MDIKRDIKQALHELGFAKPRKHQISPIRPLPDGQDIIVIAGTFSSKTAIFQTAGLVLQGLTVVIEPLLALIYNQVHELQQNGISAACAKDCADLETGRKNNTAELPTSAGLSVRNRLHAQSGLAISGTNRAEHLQTLHQLRQREKEVLNMKRNNGIHTFSLKLRRSYSEIQNIRAQNTCIHGKRDRFSLNRYFCIADYKDKGVEILLHQSLTHPN